MTAPEARVWRFGPAKQRTIAGPITPALLGGTLTSGILSYLLIKQAGIYALPVLVVPWGIVASLRVPVGALTIEAVLAPMVDWAALRLRRQQRWVAPKQKKDAPKREAPPRPAAGWEVVNLTDRNTLTGTTTNVGVFRNEPDGLWNLVCRVAGPNIALADRGAQETLTAQWMAALDRFADPSNPVTRIGLTPRLTWNSSHITESLNLTDQIAPPGGSDEMDDYLALKDALSQGLTHEVFVTLGMTDLTVRKAGRSKQITAAEFVDLALAAVTSLREAMPGFTVELLDGPGIRDVVRTTFDPWNVNAAPDAPIWPTATHVHLNRWHTADTHHQVAWAGQLPDTVTDPTWLANLLLHPSVTAPRTVSIVIELTDAPTAVRKVERQQRGREEWLSWKARRGDRVTARDEQVSAALNQTEHELTSGRGHGRWAMFVAGHARTEEALLEDMASLKNAAASAGVTLTTLYGRQDKAFIAAALPTLGGLD